MPVESLYADPVVAKIHKARRRLPEASAQSQSDGAWLPRLAFAWF